MKKNCESEPTGRYMDQCSICGIYYFDDEKAIEDGICYRCRKGQRELDDFYVCAICGHKGTVDEMESFETENDIIYLCKRHGTEEMNYEPTKKEE
jgi:hypothetical protein